MKRLLIARGFVLLFASLDTVAMVYPQTAPPSEAPANALSVPEDTTFLAALTTPIAIDQAKLNDAVEAVTSQDIKKGHDVVLKKDATLLGRVDWIDAATSVPTGPHRIMITFDRVKAKKERRRNAISPGHSGPRSQIRGPNRFRSLRDWQGNAGCNRGQPAKRSCERYRGLRQSPVVFQSWGARSAGLGIE
jgi:hypothetical protein